MEMKVLYRVCKKDTGSTLYEDELFLRVTKAEAFEICQDNFIYEYPERNEVVQKVLVRAAKAAGSEILAQRGLRKNQYLLEVELKPAESNLFDNAFIKEFFRWLLKDAKTIGATIYNDHGLWRFFLCAVDVFRPYYQGDLMTDAKAIQNRIANQN